MRIHGTFFLISYHEWWQPMCILSRKAFHFVYLVKIKSHLQFGDLFGPTFGIEHSGGHQVYATCSARLVSSNCKTRTVSVDVFCPAYSFYVSIQLNIMMRKPPNQSAMVFAHWRSCCPGVEMRQTPSMWR